MIIPLLYFSEPESNESTVISSSSHSSKRTELEFELSVPPFLSPPSLTYLSSDAFLPHVQGSVQRMDVQWACKNFTHLLFGKSIHIAQC